MRRAGNRAGARAGEDHPHILDLLLHDFQRVDQARAEHEYMAWYFRPLGRFLHGGDKGLGPEHFFSG